MQLSTISTSESIGRVMIYVDTYRYSYRYRHRCIDIDTPIHINIDMT